MLVKWAEGGELRGRKEERETEGDGTHGFDGGEGPLALSLPIDLESDLVPLVPGSVYDAQVVLQNLQ